MFVFVFCFLGFFLSEFTRAQEKNELIKSGQGEKGCTFVWPAAGGPTAQAPWLQILIDLGKRPFGASCPSQAALLTPLLFSPKESKPVTV